MADVFEKHYTKPTEQKISGGKEAKTQWMVKLEKLRKREFDVKNLVFIEEKSRSTIL